MALYRDQGLDLMHRLSSLFGGAERFVSFHGDLSERDESFLRAAEPLGYEVRRCSHDLNAIDFYESCDLHVGYRVHGHLAFLRKRIPSLLIAEDGRGLGVGYTLGPITIPAAMRTPMPPAPSRCDRVLKRLRKAAGRPQRPAPPAFAPNEHAVELAMSFLEEELESRFRRYVGVAEMIDRTYEEAMQPFIKSLP